MPCPAQHFAAELLGRLSAARDRDGMAACVLGSDVPRLTALANDCGFENAFRRELESIARPSGVLIVLSTSGQSANVIRVMECARSLDVYTAALVGSNTTDLAECDAVITVDSADPGTIQECHLLIIHSLVQLIEDAYRVGLAD